MGKLHSDTKKDGDEFIYCAKEIGSEAMNVSEPKEWNVVKGTKPKRRLILKLIHSESPDSWLQEVILKRSSALRDSVPKHLVSLDEKYLRRCMELIHKHTSKGFPCALSANLGGSSGMKIMSDYVTGGGRNSLDMVTHTVDLGVTPVNEEIVGSIMGSNSMMNIVNSPLYQRLGVLDQDVGFGGTSLFENKRCVPCEYQGSPGRFMYSPSQKPGKDALARRDQVYRTSLVQRSPLSTSSGLSVSIDQSSISTSSPSDPQGMLRCTWDDGGIPHFTFSLNDQKELYVANARKIECSGEKALDYVYTFHMRPNNQKGSYIFESESDLIGKMKVSTTFSLGTSNSKVMETEFVTVGLDDNHARDMYHMSKNNRRSRRLSKVMDMFKGGSSFKQRSTIPEDSSNASEMPISPEKQRCALDLSGNDFLPNLETAAIVVKTHLKNEDHQEVKGGWGLKFLKKVGSKQNDASLDVSTSSDCSTSMDIMVPAGPHGGPRTGIERPNSLIERWRTGHCNCGGWDIGCPLKILKARSREEEGWQSSETKSGKCKSFHVFIEGSKQETPMLKMVNVRQDLYLLSFQSSSLSSLQSFSIAVAIVHSQRPTLRPKHVHN